MVRTFRIQRAGRFSEGATMRNGPSFSGNGLPSFVSARTMSRSENAGSVSGSVNTTSYPSVAVINTIVRNALPRSFSPRGTPARSRIDPSRTPS